MRGSEGREGIRRRAYGETSVAPIRVEAAGAPVHGMEVLRAALGGADGAFHGMVRDQWVARSAAGGAAPGMRELEAARRGGGAPLPTVVRERFEAAMGHGFEHVRIHTDGAAQAAARALDAHAFALGADVFFGPGTFAPGTAEGDRLLAHELTHVVQHDEGRITGSGVSHPTDPLEREAYGAEAPVLQALDAAPAVAAEPAAPVVGGAAAQVLRDREGEGDAPEEHPMDPTEVARVLIASEQGDEVEADERQRALDALRDMDDTGSAAVLERIRNDAPALFSAILEHQLEPGEGDQVLDGTDARAEVHVFELHGIDENIVLANIGFARRSYAAQGIALEFRRHEPAGQAFTAWCMGDNGALDHEAPAEEGEPVRSAGVEPDRVLAWAAGQAPGADTMRAVFIPDQDGGEGMTVAPRWFDTATPGCMVSAEASGSTSTLAHELGHLLGLDHIEETTPGGSAQTMYPEGGGRGGAFTPAQVRTMKRSLYLHFTERGGDRPPGPGRDCINDGIEGDPDYCHVPEGRG